MIDIAAVSALKILGPNLTKVTPICSRVLISFWSNPPSGPIKTLISDSGSGLSKEDRVYSAPG